MTAPAEQTPRFRYDARLASEIESGFPADDVARLVIVPGKIVNVVTS
ncbi:MAG TPA: hypothetical protein VMA97_14670 [Streptosporangiaceae bacterium]|nr:hypothetical protein [Streptosporangiaceae bacterium]